MRTKNPTDDLSLSEVPVNDVSSSHMPLYLCSGSNPDNESRGFIKNETTFRNRAKQLRTSMNKVVVTNSYKNVALSKSQ